MSFPPPHPLTGFSIHVLTRTITPPNNQGISVENYFNGCLLTSYLHPPEIHHLPLARLHNPLPHFVSLHHSLHLPPRLLFVQQSPHRSPQMVSVWRTGVWSAALVGTLDKTSPLQEWPTNKEKRGEKKQALVRHLAVTTTQILCRKEGIFPQIP